MLFFYKFYYDYGNYKACLLTRRGDPAFYIEEDGKIVDTDGQHTGWVYIEYEDENYIGKIDFGGTIALISKDEGHRLIFQGSKEKPKEEEVKEDVISEGTVGVSEGCSETD